MDQSSTPHHIISDDNASSSLLRHNDSTIESTKTQVMQRSISGLKTELMYHNINYRLPVKVKMKKDIKHIIKDCSGIMGPGVNAILGPTGSGKTTLLDILAGRKEQKHISGTVLVNGKIQESSFHLQSGFVVQDDVVMGTLTVRENLAFSAALRLPSDFSSADRKTRVQTIIEDLGLQGCADTKVGTDERRGISGGERKRTSIGMELIIAPDVLFLDEPTTGLDAFTACQVIQRLQRQAEKGRTIIFSIHQPRYSIFKLFDTITLLSAGETVYHGPNENALEYFQNLGFVCEEHNNPADHFLDIISQDMRKIRETSYIQIDTDNTNFAQTGHLSYTKLADYYVNSDYFKSTLEKVESAVEAVDNSDEPFFSKDKKLKYQSSFPRQMWFLSQRAFLNLVRDLRAFRMQLFINLLYAVVFGGVFFQLEKGPGGLQNRNGILYFLTTDTLYANLSAISIFMRERKVFRHESANGYYRISSYFFAKVFCDLLPMRLFPLLIFCGILYSMAGLRADVVSFFIFAFTLILESLCSVGLCMFVGSSTELIGVATLLAATPFTLMYLSSGFLIRVADIPVVLRWLQYISIPRYTLTALQMNELHDMTFGTACGKYHNVTCTTGNEYLQQQGINYDHDLIIDFIALACFIVGFFFLTYIQIRRRRKLT